MDCRSVEHESASRFQRALVVLHQRRERQIASKEVVPLPAPGVVRPDELRCRIDRKAQHRLCRGGFGPASAGHRRALDRNRRGRCRRGWRRRSRTRRRLASRKWLRYLGMEMRQVRQQPSRTGRARSGTCVDYIDYDSGWDSKPEAVGLRLKRYEQFSQDRPPARPAQRNPAGHRRDGWRRQRPRVGVRLRRRHELRVVLVLGQDRVEDVPGAGSRARSQAVGHDPPAGNAREPAHAEGLRDPRQLAERVCDRTEPEPCRRRRDRRHHAAAQRSGARRRHRPRARPREAPRHSHQLRCRHGCCRHHDDGEHDEVCGVFRRRTKRRSRRCQSDCDDGHHHPGADCRHAGAGRDFPLA